MMNREDTRLADWAIRKIETEFSGDICLLLEHRTLRLEHDRDAKTFSYYIPATNRANGLARTFIIQGIGYDLFPISWERVERMADVKEYNTTCLADAEILWARSEADRQRFRSLQARLSANVQNPHYMLERARKWYDVAREIHQDALFEERAYKARENAGHICDLLSLAVAFANGRYFKHGQTSQLQVLSGMEKVPKEFATLYEAILREPSPDAQKRLCHALLLRCKAFLDEQESPAPTAAQADYTELAAWYQELIYTWRRVYHWCDANDPMNAYIWCCNLQNEVETWGAKFGIADRDILGAFDAEDLAALRHRAEAVESAFRQAIFSHGVTLDAYDSVEAFLQAN